MTHNTNRKQQAFREHRIWMVNFMAAMLLGTLSIGISLITFLTAISGAQPIVSIQSALLLVGAVVVGFIGGLCSVFCDWRFGRYLNVIGMGLALAIIGVNLLPILGLLGLSWNV